MSVTDYPTDENGNHDHEAAIEEMGFTDVSSANPQFYVAPSGNVLAVIDVDADAGEVTGINPSDLLNTDTWTANLQVLWDEWANGSLTFRSREYLAPEEATYNTEQKAAIDRPHLAELADISDRLLEEITYSGESPDGDLAEAVRAVYATLDFHDGFVTLS